MAPEVLNFRRNQLKALRQEENKGFDFGDLLGVGALAAGVGAGAYGLSRGLGGSRGRVTIVDDSLTPETIRRAQAAPEGVKYGVEGATKYGVGAIGNLTRDLNPPPSKTSTSQTADLTPVATSKEPGTLLGFLRDVREQEDLRNVARPATPYRPGSLADRVAREQQQNVQNQLDGNNPETKTYVAKLNERRSARAAQAQELADKVKNALISGGEQEGYDLSVPQGATAGSSAASAFAKAEEREQQRQPAPITKDWNDKLFDEHGMLRTDVIATHLGDENVIPKTIAEQLVASAEVDRRGNILSFTSSPAVFQATRHVRENLLTSDYQDSIKNYLVSGDPGDLQPAQSRGFGWSARSTAPTDVITIQSKEGEPSSVSVKRRASAKYDISDLEPLYLDPITKTLTRKADIGTSGTADMESGSGIGEEIGQTVAFVPREEIAPFVSTPGVSASGTEKYKNQGVGYAIGGVKEFGGSSGAGRQDRDPSLPVLSTEEHVANKNVGFTKNGNLYAKVKPVALAGDPRLSQRLDQDYGNFFYRNPITNKPWRSPDEAAAFVNQVHSQFNEKQLNPIQSQLETKELYRGPMQVVLTGRDAQGRQRRTWLDPFQKLSNTGEATLASQVQNMLLQKGVIQEVQTEEGARYLRQTRYSVPDVIDDQETKTWTLGPEHIGAFPSTTDHGKRNHYEYLEAVQNAYKELTGNGLADIDTALTLRKQKAGLYLGGPSSNPYLNKALTVANTLTQISEPTRQRMREPGAQEDLGDRYGLGATVSAKPLPTVPSRMQNTDAPPEVIGAKRLSSALTEYRQRSGRPMRQSDFLQFASSIAQQEGADVNELIRQTSILSRGAGEQAVVGRSMSQGRRALSAMDRISPAEEVAQTVLEYDYGENVGSDIEDALRAAQATQDIDKELAARQAQRAKVEPPGAFGFELNDQDLSNAVGRMLAQGHRRAGSRRNR
jgi:hypothetical protein